MIREYLASDIDALISIWLKASAVAHPFLTEEFMAQGTRDMRNIYLPNAETWVLETQGQPAGFISLIGDEIGGLFLAPASHGRGFGRALVDHAYQLKGPLCVEVFEKNSIGRRFYDRYGFIETGRYDDEASGQVVIKMSVQKPG